MKNWFNKVLYQQASTRAFFTLWGVILNEIKVSVRQFYTWKNPFTVLQVVKYIFQSLLRMVLGRSVKLSYGFSGEDRLIESLLKPKITDRGYYVEVGCNHPTLFSNTFLFYRRGWSGICIDGNKKLIKKYKFSRPKDTAICAIVSDSTKPLEYLSLTNDVLSTVERTGVEQFLEQGQKITSREVVKPRSLTSILDVHEVPKHFNFLSIDAEGHDMNVLRSLDLNRYQPKLILLELENFDAKALVDNEVYQVLKDFGYIFAGIILKNVYFIKD
ncbi:FkbM family methyltransferase [Fulvivirga sp. M361]|uniref:FkbM family methyltransferase n=1 Tax=Fulvivirga sp. M361 TaxID=2594266 RepID=UPI00117A2F57|nr:FkbM family methyltransferase [Fulvivirga sp. M361]TRX57785.1 FkbM family methyltransferase [Fulvivirga sp. M361]